MASIVDPLIKSHKVMVFSKTTCPYCDKAKRVLAKYDIKDKHIVELDKGYLNKRLKKFNKNSKL